MRRIWMACLGYVFAQLMAAQQWVAGGAAALLAAVILWLCWSQHRPLWRPGALWILAGGAAALMVGGIHSRVWQEDLTVRGPWLGRVQGYSRGVPDAVLLSVLPADAGRSKVRVRLAKERLLLRPGDRVIFQSRVRPLRPPLNEYEFDARRHWGARGITARTSAGRALAIPPGQGSLQCSLLRKLADLRWRIAQALEQAEVPSETKGVLLALLLGDGGAVPHAMRRRYTVSGTAHLLAVSGLHLATLFMSVFFLIRRLLRRWPGRRGQAVKLGLIGGLWVATFYLLITGAPTSCMRAYLMLLGFSASQWLERDYDLFNWLGLASLATLAWRPHALFEAGFQLSTIAVASIAWAAKQRLDSEVEEAERKGAIACMGQILGYLKQVAWVSAAAWVGTAPVVWYHFHAVPLAGVPANVLAVPLMTFAILPLALLFGLLTAVIETSAGWLLEWVRHLLFIQDGFLDLWSQWLPELVAPWPGTVVAGVLALMLLFAVFSARPRLRVLCGIAAAGLLCAVLAMAWHGPEEGTVFVHAGEGDAAILHLACGETVLVDGGRPETGRRSTLNYLRAHGVTSIALAILSHGHQDHYGGLIELGRRIPIRTVIHPPGEAAQWAAAQIPVPGGTHRKQLSVGRGAQFAVCGTKFTVLWPPPGLVPQLAENDRSLVLLVQTGDLDYLFTGDITDAVPDRLIGSLPQVDVLKVPHHGHPMKSARRVLDATSPGLVVVSGERSSGWGERTDGNPEVACGASHTYVTGQVGAITIKKRGCVDVFSKDELSKCLK